jgi:type 1 glutamine amidotransferase
MTRTLVLSGGGRYADPWHPLGATSLRLAAIAERLGHEVEVAEELEERLVDVGDVDVIVVNAASGPVTASHEAAVAGLRGFLGRGGAVLAVHVGASSLIDWPEWERVTGMRWVQGVSMHPPLGPSHVVVHPGRHVIAAPLRDFDVLDERYCGLRLAPDVVPFVTHDHEGATQPLVWARTYGTARVVTNALGHGPESYDSPEHVQLLLRSYQWLTRELPEAGAA